MSALAEQVSRYSQARERLGFPLTPVKRIRLPWVPAPVVKVIKPVVADAAPKPLPSKRMHWMAIVQQVSVKHNVDAKSILGPARNRHISRARNEVFYRMRSEIIVAGEPMSLPEIARRFGRDHTTCLHGIRVHCRENGLPLPRGRHELSTQSTQCTETRTNAGFTHSLPLKTGANQRSQEHSSSV